MARANPNGPAFGCGELALDVPTGGSPLLGGRGLGEGWQADLGDRLPKASFTFLEPNKKEADGFQIGDVGLHIPHHDGIRTLFKSRA